MRALRAGQFLVASGLLACLATACGNSSGTSEGTGAKGSGAGGPKLGNVGGSSSSGGSSGDISDTCAGELIQAKSIPLDMYVMLDSSGSMLDPTEGNAAVTKWDAVSAALTDFVNDPESAGLGVGLKTFPQAHPDAPATCTSNQQCGEFGPCFLKACWPPEDGGLLPCNTGLQCDSFQCVTFGVCANDDAYVCPTVGNPCGTDMGKALGNCVAAPPSICLMNADCRAASYATPASPIAQLPGAATALVAAIDTAEPDGLTPSGPALEGAIAHASSWASDHPDHQVVAVLATDGLPTLETGADGMSCLAIDSQAQVDAVAQLAAQGRAGTPPITTFVIGVFGSNDVGGPETLGAIAQAGGTMDAFIVDTQGDVTAQFREALNKIRGMRLSCELAVPAADAGKTVDFDLVNVTFDDGTGPQELFYVEQASGCDASTDGWYYDKLPSAGHPERIVVCPSTCAKFGQADMGSVQIKLGCAMRKPL